MINVVARSGALAPLMKATSQAAATSTVPIVAAIAIPKPKPPHPMKTVPLTSKLLSATLPTGNLLAVSGPAVTSSVRMAHSDIKVPDFSAYRRESVQSPYSDNRESADTRKSFTYVMVAASSVFATYATKNVVLTFVMSMAASADVLAMSKIEIKLDDIPEGKNVTFKWRGKPLFVRHRTAEEITTEEAVDVSSLRDQQHDKDRVQKPEWLIVIGVCTHLGCVPIANSGDYGGYYCPCHGSHYDASGRIRRGPAPTNLEVPSYVFPEENIVVVG